MKKDAKEKIVVFFSLAAMVGLMIAAFYVMVKIVPQYAQAYSTASMELPKLAKICFMASNFVAARIVLLAIVLVIAAIASVIMAFTVKKCVLLAELFTVVATAAFCLITVSFYATRLTMMQVDSVNKGQFSQQNYVVEQK
jgi:type II secretory pathway component PulF